MSENVWLQMKYKKPANQVLIGFRREIEKEDEILTEPRLLYASCLYFAKRQSSGLFCDLP